MPSKLVTHQVVKTRIGSKIDPAAVYAGTLSECRKTARARTKVANRSGKPRHTFKVLPINENP